MTQMTLDDLTRILREAAGADEAVDLSGDILDTPFDDLGYDSIAMLETASRIQVAYKVVLSDDAFIGAETPRELIDLVNGLLTTAPST
ncbi:acyl carrier protein [Nocardia sp. CDC159]|uniref:Acyl carrier protein n=1 Tax=Nocardia pulmonis TaxID=2951408 RepID=A0A9X2E1H5_9NOCA|nr:MULTISPECIES: acyl carrier protein [Nocardia]MCM6771860.1 acyl carrier protein [Nocardia pulmonis]MCM6785482.1 acyl carrier protein [Nocardia sp. CDC159]